MDQATHDIGAAVVIAANNLKAGVHKMPDGSPARLAALPLNIMSSDGIETMFVLVTNDPGVVEELSRNMQDIARRPKEGS